MKKFHEDILAYGLEYSDIEVKEQKKVSKNLYNFLYEFKRQDREHIHFLIKFIFNILCIVKKYIKFRNYSFSFKQTFSNPIFSTLQSNTPKNISKKLIKLNNDNWTNQENNLLLIIYNNLLRLFSLWKLQIHLPQKII